MKKTILLFLTVLLLAASGCQNPRETSPPARIEALSAEVMTLSLDEFVGDRGESGYFDRTSFSDGEARAAAHIVDMLSDAGIAANTVSVEVDGTSLKTSNVEATYNPGKEKTVVLTANYDNRYSAISDLGLSGDGSAGLLDNAMSVAALISLARHIFHTAPALDYTLVFLFVGGGALSGAGGGAFLRTHPDGVALAVNLRRIAGKKLYAYVDESKTKLETMFLKSAAPSGRFNPLPPSAPRWPLAVLPGLAYSHAGLEGAHLSFMAAGIKTVNLFGGDPFRFSFNGVLPADSPASLSYLYPGYADSMSDTAHALHAFLLNEQLLGTVLASTRKTYGIWTRPAFYAGIALLLIVVAAAVLILISRRSDEEPRTPKHTGNKPPPSDIFPEY